MNIISLKAKDVSQLYSYEKKETKNYEFIKKESVRLNLGKERLS